MWAYASLYDSYLLEPFGAISYIGKTLDESEPIPDHARFADWSCSFLCYKTRGAERFLCRTIKGAEHGAFFCIKVSSKTMLVCRSTASLGTCVVGPLIYTQQNLYKHNILYSVMWRFLTSVTEANEPGRKYVCGSCVLRISRASALYVIPRLTFILSCNAANPKLQVTYLLVVISHSTI